MASNDLPAIVLASQILAQAITEDIDEVVKQGAGLDRSVQHLLREVGQNILEQVYDPHPGATNRGIPVHKPQHNV